MVVQAVRTFPVNKIGDLRLCCSYKIYTILKVRCFFKKQPIQAQAKSATSCEQHYHQYMTIIIHLIYIMFHIHCGTSANFTEWAMAAPLGN